MAKNSMYRVPDNVRNALGADTVMGMSPNVNRLSLLPRYDAQDGLVAPQWLYDLARAAQAPGNALMGAPTSPEDAFNFAGNVSLGALGASAAMKSPAPGPGKTIPMFAGPNAKTADLAGLERAKQMIASGADDGAAWRETGWWVNTPDGVPRFEIDDSAAIRVNPVKENKPAGWFPQSMGDEMRHESLYAAYPEIGGYKFAGAPPAGPFDGARGGFDPQNKTFYSSGADDAERLSVNLHEGQHAVQHAEDMAAGGGPGDFPEMAKREALFQRDAVIYARELRAMEKRMPGADLSAIQNAVRDEYERIGALDWLPGEAAQDLGRQPFMVYPEKYPKASERVLKNISEWGLDKAATPRSSMDMYRRLAGEAEARLVQKRMNYTPEQRRSIYPWDDYDVPRNELIVRR